MKSLTQVPELDRAIAAHGCALESGAPLGEFIAADARERCRAVMDAVLKDGPLAGFQPVGKARIGFQYMSKIRFTRGGRPVVLLNRWKDENGTWRIAEVTDLSAKRSGWSEAETPASARRENGHA